MTKFTQVALAAILLTLSLIVSAAGTTATSQQEGGDGVRRITPAELRTALKKGKAVIVDVRGLGAYQVSHIKGALTIPVTEMAARYSELPKNKLIATYCS
ncbi:MAG TPA: rhodanese-like domain-containing protein [Pyrinomonadaceae bacterium]|nr:rhodanese-like domain-containing protein [Pyrinomonadaceae bacterium]